MQSHNHLPVIVIFHIFSKLHNAQNQVREWFKQKGPKFRFYKFLIICFGMFRCHTRETNIAWFLWETLKLSSLQSWCSFDVHDSFGIGKSRHANVFQANLTVTLVDLFGIGWAAKKWTSTVTRLWQQEHDVADKESSVFYCVIDVLYIYCIWFAFVSMLLPWSTWPMHVPPCFFLVARFWQTLGSTIWNQVRKL